MFERDRKPGPCGRIQGETEMEQVDVYDLNKKRTGRVLPREGIFGNLEGDERILLVHTCVFDADHRMLIQQRKETKTYCPGCWDVSAGGFVLAGEGSLEAAVRETEEELGLKLPAESLDYVCCEPFGKVLDDFYNVCVDADVRNLRLQESEVMGVAWADRDTVLRMIRDGRFVDYSEELIAGVFDKAGQAGHKASMKSKYFGELSTKELYEILRARAEIFVVEQNCVYQDLDGTDYDSLHVFWEEDGKVTAYMRAFRKDDETVQMGRVLTLRHGTGLGGRLLSEGIAQIRAKMHPARIYIEAQCYATGFYEREGFQICSEAFLEDGIPHVQMVLQERDKSLFCPF